MGWTKILDILYMIIGMFGILVGVLSGYIPLIIFGSIAFVCSLLAFLSEK